MNAVVIAYVLFRCRKNSIIKLRGNTTVIHNSDIHIDRTPTNIFIVLNRVSDNDSAL